MLIQSMPRCTVLMAGFLFLFGSFATAGESKYVGVEKCKSCHASATKGDQHGAWLKMKHAQAFGTLASAEAKKIAAEKKIDDPQKSDACLPCHVTAFGVPAEQKHKKFDQTQGVQCESCHGPGGNHVAARLAAEGGDETKVQAIGKDEIIHDVAAEVCKKCHNEKSPTFKPPFCFRKAAKATAHLDPRRNHPADFYDKLPCDCPECKK